MDRFPSIDYAPKTSELPGVRGSKSAFWSEVQGLLKKTGLA